MFKSGFVSIIGKTNVGKSTLINNLVKEKVAITTSKKQTTRTLIKAIVNSESSQIIFMDTPGIHKTKNKLGETMIETAWKTMEEVDSIIYIIEATDTRIDQGNKIILEKLKGVKTPVILIVNKIDLVKKEKILEVINMYQNEYDFSDIIPISALDSTVSERIVKSIEKNLKEGPVYYDIDEYTDQTARQIVEEKIREKALKLLNDEIPHGIYIEVEKMNLRKTTKGEEIYDVEAIIYCIKKSHKGIIIGKDGAMLKKIGMYARQDIEGILDTKVNLKVWVKIQENWQDNDNILKRFKT